MVGAHKRAHLVHKRVPIQSWWVHWDHCGCPPLPHRPLTKAPLILVAPTGHDPASNPLDYANNVHDKSPGCIVPHSYCGNSLLVRISEIMWFLCNKYIFCKFLVSVIERCHQTYSSTYQLESGPFSCHLCRVALGDNNNFNLFDCWIAMTDNVFSLSVVPKVFEYLEHRESKTRRAFYKRQPVMWNPD